MSVGKVVLDSICGASKLAGVIKNVGNGLDVTLRNAQVKRSMAHAAEYFTKSAFGSAVVFEQAFQTGGLKYLTKRNHPALIEYAEKALSWLDKIPYMKGKKFTVSQLRLLNRLKGNNPDILAGLDMIEKTYGKGVVFDVSKTVAQKEGAYIVRLAEHSAAEGNLAKTALYVDKTGARPIIKLGSSTPLINARGSATIDFNALEKADVATILSDYSGSFGIKGSQVSVATKIADIGNARGTLDVDKTAKIFDRLGIASECEPCIKKTGYAGATPRSALTALDTIRTKMAFTLASVKKAIFEPRPRIFS